MFAGDIGHVWSCEVTISAGWVTPFPIPSSPRPWRWTPPAPPQAPPCWLRRQWPAWTAQCAPRALGKPGGFPGATRIWSSTRETIDCNPDFPMKMCEFMGGTLTVHGKNESLSWKFGNSWDVEWDLNSPELRNWTCCCRSYEYYIYISLSLCSDKIRVEIANRS